MTPGAEMTDTAQTIIQIIADKALLDVDTLSPDKVLADLGVDSLGLVEAIFAIEEAFDISVPFNVQDGAGFDATSIASIIAGVEGLLAQKAA